MRFCARAPVRVDPAGGGTDAPPFRVEHGGAVVNFAIQRHAFASVQRMEEGSGVALYAMDLHLGSTAKSARELACEGPMAFVEAFVRRLTPPEESLLVLTETDVPPGSGLGGSGALGVALVAALDRLCGRKRSPLETALLANDIERSDLGFSGGDQDSLGAALGGMNLLEYACGGAVSPRPLAVRDDVLRALEYGSLLAYSGAAHVSGSIHEDIKRSYALADSPTVAAMQSLREEAYAMAKALESGSLTQYAESLSASCRQLYRLHPSCDCEKHRTYFKRLDELLLGGKTCGAGGGGFLLLFVKPGARSECRRRIESLGGISWPVTIDRRGMTTWVEAPLEQDAMETYRRLASGAP